MAGLKTLLGLYPTTSSYENKRKQIEDEYSALQEYANSEELAKYNELSEYVKSVDFKSTKKELLGLRYKGSDEFRKEGDLKRLSKDKNVKLYIRTLSSPAYSNYNSIANSNKVKRYEELKAQIDSESSNKANGNSDNSGEDKFLQSDLGGTLKAYQQQKDSDRISGYKRFAEDKLFKDFQKLEGSDKIKKYEELKKLVESASFAKKKSSMTEAKFAASADGKKLAEFNKLEKAKDITNFIKHSQSPDRKFFDELHESDELEAFLDLENFVNSDDFKRQREAIEGKPSESESAADAVKEFEKLTNDPQIRSYTKFLDSPEYQNLESMKGSHQVAQYDELSKIIQSQDFIARKNYLTLSPKIRWQQSEPYQKDQELKRIQSSGKVKWFFKTKDHKKFKFFNTWEKTFEDDFDSGQLDREKWLTRYYWGEELMQDSYSLVDEKHCITDGKNIDVSASVLKITTRREQVEGRIWNPEMGFMPHEFNYSSGLINTGKSFRQKFGLFEARIRVASNPDLLNAFWMVGDQMLPHIDVFKAQSKCSVGITTDSSIVQKALKRNRYSSEYHIVSMEWEPNKIVWRINGLEVTSATYNIPQEEMYLAFSSGLYKNDVPGMPASMEIDWVKCYKRK